MIMGNMKALWIVLVLWFLSASAQAQTNVCLIPDEISLTKSIAWDPIKLTAEAIDSLGNTHKGKVTLISDHKPNGVKTNLFVLYTEPYFGADASEYIVFSTGKEFRVIGVNYVFRNGKYHLKSSSGNHVANCRL
jgi:hypothetical protein